MRPSAKLIRPGDPIPEREGIPDIYERNENYPETLVQISNPMVMRSVTVQKLSVFPFQHNPINQTLTVTQYLEIELKAVTDTYETSSQEGSRAFESIYENLITNYSRPVDYQQSAILYICGGYACDTDAFQDLKQWRHQQGFTVYTASTYEIGYSTDVIADYIKNSYESLSPSPEYVTLVGDVGGEYHIPTYLYTNTFCNSGFPSYGDYPYTLLSGGDDPMPDVLIGRIPAGNYSELETVINKIVNYEKATYMDILNSWYERALLSANSASQASSLTTNESIAYMMTNAGMDDVVFYVGNNYDDEMVYQMEEGILYLNHRDTGGGQDFTVNDVEGANNGYQLPFVTLITCTTGIFHEGDAITEEIVTLGTVSYPKGGIAAVGMDGITHTLYNNIIDMGIYHGIFVNGTTSAGGALLEGKLALMNAYPDMENNPSGCNEVENYSYMTNLMGDAALKLWTDTPGTMIIDSPETIQFGSNLVSISIVDTNLNPVSDVQITLLKQDGNIEDIFLSNYTNEFGLVEFILDYNTTGEITLTASKHNYKPIITTIEIVDNENIELSIGDEIGIIDGAEGQLNPGETVTLQIPIQNIGSGNISAVQVQLSSSSTWINIINDTVILGELSSGENMNAEFEFSLSPELVFSEQISFLVHIISDNTEDWYFQLSIPVYSHWFDIEDIVFHTGGNPGQVSEIDFTLLNTGNLSSDEFITVLEYTGSGNVEILSDTVLWSGIDANSSDSLMENYIVTIGSDIINGSILSFNLSLLFSESSPIILPFTLISGETAMGVPLGPDEYGYYIYDSGDTLYNLAPYYYWKEIDPLYGGAGTPLNLYDNGHGNPSSQSSPVINLPFPIYFYGVEYNQITISTNGWISFGESEMESFRNTPVPGPGGPSPMLAAFWDDLRTADGDVYYYYDDVSESVIIEWSRMETYQHHDPITLQAILFGNKYSQFYDNDILIQYLDFNNTTNGYYPEYYGETPIHGSYATIGIENHDASIGLQYTFNNEYSSIDLPLNDGSAILITTRPSTNLFNVDIQHAFIGQSIHFNTNDNYDIETWAWDFNMDGIIDSDSSFVQWTYNESGPYDVCLKISDGINEYTDIRYNFILINKYGCIDHTACTYDPEATIDDGSCEFYDCTGECGGTAVEDECGVCDGDGIQQECGCGNPGELGIPVGDCDCYGTILDECGVCDGYGSIYGDAGCCMSEVDCAGVCGGDSIVDGIDCGGVSLQIQNVDTGVGTLDIFMSNYAGCSYCADSTYNYNTWDWVDTKEACEILGGSSWIVYEPITEEECSTIPSLDGNGGWWFNGEVKGFQINISGVTITGASGGSAESAGFIVSASETTVLGFSLTSAFIPAGASTLTTISFSNFNGIGICLPYNQEGSPTTHTPVISDTDGNQIDTEVGDCYIYEEPIYGCTDEVASNYNPDANLDDGSCEYCDLGDVNCDGTLNVLDIVIAANMVLADEYDEVADVNEDGELNILDLVTLVTWVLYGDDGACIDYDGNVYETIQIGEQLWMAENLKVTHYSDGSEIPTGYSDEEWAELDTGAYAVYDDDPVNADIYGNLYNWYAVDDDRGVCPDGFHVPTDEEFMELEMELGMSESEANDTSWRGTNEGSKLAGNADLWIDGDLENNSEFGMSGFSAFPAGYRSTNGFYYDIDYRSYFWSWSSAEFNNYKAWYRYLFYSNSNVSRFTNFKHYGFSIRCLGD